MKKRIIRYDDLKFCNCAKCNKELLGSDLGNVRRARNYYNLVTLPAMVHVRLNDRPYCKECCKANNTDNRSTTYQKKIYRVNEGN